MRNDDQNCLNGLQPELGLIDAPAHKIVGSRGMVANDHFAKRLVKVIGPLFTEAVILGVFYLKACAISKIQQIKFLNVFITNGK